MFRWLSGRGASKRQVERQLAAIDDADWRKTVAALPFLQGLTEAENAELRRKAAWLLASKTFSGAHGMEVTDDMMLSIAAQASLPILALDTAWYEGWTEIILYPGDFLIPRTEVEESGVVHEYVQEASGEAWDGGPVILSWEAASLSGEAAGINVVIHEFAHKLDCRSGEADGMPHLGGTNIRYGHWRRVLEASFDAFEQALTAVEDAIPHDVDPESPEAAPWYDALPMDPYAATDPAEFFAVSSETFFIDPKPLAAQLPEWYALLCAFYRQDPMLRLPEPPRPVAG